MLLGELAGIGSAALWACSSLIMADLSRRMPALAVSFLRLSVGLLFYLALLIATGHAGDLVQIGVGRTAALGLSAILAMGIGDTLYIAGMHRIGVSKASPISVTSYPLLTVVLAWLLLGEVLSAAAILGTFLVVIGIVLVVVRPDDAPLAADAGPITLDEAPELDRDDRVPVAVGRATNVAAPVAIEMARPAGIRAPRLSWVGVWLVLIAAVTWAFSTIWLRQLTEDTNLIVVNAVRVPIAALFVGSLAVSRGALQLRRYRPRDLLLVAGAGIVGSGVGSLMYVFALKEAGAGRSAILNSLSPVFALPLAAWLLSERVTKLTVAGTVLALAGAWLVIT